jgi:hypothetical protein
MSSEDQVQPYHAKDEARGQEAADAVAAVMKHAATQDEIAHRRITPKKQPKWMLPFGVNLAVLAVYLLIAPPGWITVNPIEGPDLARQGDDMRAAMWLQAQQVEAYRIQNGRLPTTLAESGRVTAGVEYIRDGDHFRLIAAIDTIGDDPVIWDSNAPNTEFEAIVAARMGG